MSSGWLTLHTARATGIWYCESLDALRSCCATASTPRLLVDVIAIFEE